MKRAIRIACFWMMGLLLVAMLPWQAAVAQNSDQFVLLRTTRGSILIRVFSSMVPYTANNFLDLVNRGFYDGLSFHRVEDWVVQGGDPNGNGTGNFIDPDTGNARYLKLQTHRNLTHNAGMVAMARSSNPNSASCQFYMLKRSMHQLDGKYAVFGKVIKGQGTVNLIGRGDQIVMARVVDPNTLQPPGEGGGGGGWGGGQAVPGVAEPVQRQAPPQPGTGDAGF